MNSADYFAPLEARPLQQYEESVIFSEWRGLRHCATRSLTRTGELMRALGYDPKAVGHRTLGVVGSKGKGTAAAYASAALAGLGHRVGTVMSPGVISNADRVRINGQVLDEDTRRRALGRIQRARDQLPEATVESGYLAPTGLFIVLAMLTFAEAQVEVVVAEAGIGGASDDLSHWDLDGVAVTGIFAEHLHLLGPTVADVAADKAAVISPATQFCVSAGQSREPEEVLQARCAAVGTPLMAAGAPAGELVKDLPAGFARDNAAVGVSAGLALASVAAGGAQGASAHSISQTAAQSGPQGDIGAAFTESNWSAADSHRRDAVARVVGSVNYPGRLSVHQAPGGRRCVVDSAVSAAGLAAALQFASGQLGAVDQVLVCLPPDKDLGGFIEVLGSFAGRKVFVELPGAYTDMPERAEWPWDWLGQDELSQLLADGDSLVVGTVLYTSQVLRILGTDTDRLFTR